MSKKMKKKRSWLLNGRWIKKRTCRWVNTAPTTAIPCQAPEGAKQLQAKPSQVLMKRLLEIFFFLIHFRICHLGYEAETEGNLLGFFSNSNSCPCLQTPALPRDFWLPLWLLQPEVIVNSLVGFQGKWINFILKNKDWHFGLEIFAPLPIFFWLLFACLWLIRPVPLPSDNHFHMQSTNPLPQLPTFAPTSLYRSPTAIHTFASNILLISSPLRCQFLPALAVLLE